MRWLASTFLPVAFAGLACMGWATHRMNRGDIAAWLKGARSEEHVGQVLEYAITMRGCAVARSVTEIAGAGDIDHLVATPAALWVVETKSSRVPRRHFPSALSGLARKMKHVRDWAPAGAPVRGCLVLDDPNGARRRRYDADDETIRLHTAHSLAKALSAEASAEPAVSPALARNVWQLGRVEE